MRERPILFNSEMVRAIYDGKKTQTRRPIKPQPDLDKRNHRWGMQVSNGVMEYGRAPWRKSDPYNFIVEKSQKCPFGKQGDRLWVRETHAVLKEAVTKRDIVAYKATEQASQAHDAKWTPSIHMKREHSRFLLEISNIEAQRLDEMTEQDALCEGFHSDAVLTEDGSDYTGLYAVDRFMSTWDEIYSSQGLGTIENPWVWVVYFNVVRWAK